MPTRAPMGHHLLCVILLLTVLSKANVADLVLRPRNAVVLEGTPVVFHCMMSANDSCHWLAAESADHSLLTIYDGDDAKLDRDKYSVNTSSPGQCDLIVLKPTMGSRLRYACSADKWVHREARASLTVLKSNLLCADNVYRGQTRLSYDRTIRFSFYLVFASDRGVGVSVYREGPNESIVPICGDVHEKETNIGRLHCDYELRRDDAFRFFAAVTEIGDFDRFVADKTVPGERFYCFCNDWFEVTDEPGIPTDSSDTVEPKNATTMLLPTGVPEKSPDDLPIWCRALFILLSIVLCVLAIAVAVIALCRLRNRCKRFEFHLPKNVGDGENEKFAEV